MTRPVTLGPYLAGECPENWVHDFDDFDGAPLDLTAYTAQLTYVVGDGAQVVRDATLVSAPDGRVGMAWVAADFATTGWMRGELTVGNNGSQRYAQSFVCHIRVPLGGPLPAI